MSDRRDASARDGRTTSTTRPRDGSAQAGRSSAGVGRRRIARCDDRAFSDGDARAAMREQRRRIVRDNRRLQSTHRADNTCPFVVRLGVPVSALFRVRGGNAPVVIEQGRNPDAHLQQQRHQRREADRPVTEPVEEEAGGHHSIVRPWAANGWRRTPPPVSSAPPAARPRPAGHVSSETAAGPEIPPRRAPAVGDGDHH